MWPSSTSSSTPVTVSVCPTAQFDGVNVSVDGDTVTSPVSADEIDNTTSEDGSVMVTWIVSVVPDSATLFEKPLSVVVMLAVSLSALVAVTDWLATSS